MENRKYVIKRNNIHVGEVVSVNNIYRTEEINNIPGQLKLSSYYSYRSMLFVPDEQRLSSDLLYRTPAYPILNFTDDDICLKSESKIIIRDACNLGLLLAYFGYGENLSYKDIIEIRKIFFSGNFAKDNCELFGYKERQPEEYIYFKDGIPITDPKEIKKCIENTRSAQKLGYREFKKIGGEVLPEEYWHVLDARGDNSLRAVLEDLTLNMNAFAPHKDEGMIRKLRRL